MDIRYPVYQPYLSGREAELVQDCLSSTWISSKGKYVEEFEKISSLSDKTINHLIGYNLIEKSDNKVYHVKINAVKNYILEHTKIQQSYSKIEDKWSSITKKRNSLE